MMPRLIARLVVVLAVGAASVLSTGEIRAADPPRPGYRLSPGDEITYRTVARSQRRGGETAYHVDWKVWAVDRDAEGTTGLVIRCDLIVKNPDSAGTAPADPADTIVWRCRLGDDGRLVGASTRGTVRDPFRFFPRLPDDPAALATGWESTGPEGEQVKIKYQLASPPAPGSSTLAIAATAASPEDKVYLTEHRYRADFDRERGLVTRVETDDSCGYGITGTTHGLIELIAVDRKGPEWAAGFKRDADGYFAAVAAYEAAATRAGRDAGQCGAILAESKTNLRAARDAVGTPFLQEALDKQLARHDGMIEYQVEQARRRAEFVGKSADEWEAKDMEGKVHRLVDYRGRVVVMDFWYRGCGWCMTAMPQVNRLAEAFRDRPVAVLGMSIDKDEKDARVVIEAMNLRYPTIRAADLPEKFGVQGYPTLIVVDQRGKIREVHVGYSPRLFDELTGLIRDLLDEKPAE